MRILIVKHRLCPVTKEIHSDGESVSYFLLTAVFSIPDKINGSNKTVVTNDVK